jgi:hypothetical protein
MMKRIGKYLTLAGLLAVPALGFAQDAPPRPPCVDVSTFVRYSVGYDHVVRIDNGCDKDVACVVRTNVNPDPIAVDVAAGKTEYVVTYRGSPAREFTADVRCTADG